MKRHRRRKRRTDPLANEQAVRKICYEILEHVGDAKMRSDNDLLKFFYSLLHVERYSATDTKRGRSSYWSREKKLAAASRLGVILDRETSGRVSSKSFITLYLQILKFPPDLLDALDSEIITLYEAAQFARLTPEKLALDLTNKKVADRRAATFRKSILESHLTVSGTHSALRYRIDAIIKECAGAKINIKPDDDITQETALNTESEPVPQIELSEEDKKKLEEAREDTLRMQAINDFVDEFLSVHPHDPRHLFYEELKQIFYSLQEVKPEDVDKKSLEELLDCTGKLSFVLAKIERKRKAKTEVKKTIRV